MLPGRGTRKVFKELRFNDLAKVLRRVLASTECTSRNDVFQICDPI